VLEQVFQVYFLQTMNKGEYHTVILIACLEIAR
jgi:hypothetical protein